MKILVHFAARSCSESQQARARSLFFSFSLSFFLASFLSFVSKTIEVPFPYRNDIVRSHKISFSLSLCLSPTANHAVLYAENEGEEEGEKRDEVDEGLVHLCNAS